MFTVIVPTMWKADLFVDFLINLVQHPLVHEVIIIDNDYQNKPHHQILRHKKIKLICFGRNIYVNPAWNLGVQESSTDRICIMNDDVQFDLRLFDKINEFLNAHPETGSIGLSPGVKHLNQKPHTSTEINIIECVSGQDLLGYGSLFFTKRSLWRAIPHELKIYCGDAFVFDRSIWMGLKNYLITDISHQIQYATTCNSVDETGITLSHGFLEKESIIYENIRKHKHLYIEPNISNNCQFCHITNKTHDQIFFGGAMSLGDVFVMNAIVHEYAAKCNLLIYPVKPEYYSTIKCLYQDWPNIQVIAFESIQQQDEYVKTHNIHRIFGKPLETSHIHRVNCNEEYIHVHWPQQIYENFNILYSKRYTEFKMPRYIEGTQELYNKLSANEPYILVHRYTGDHPHGIPINVPAFRKSVGLPDLPIIEIREGQTDNMLQYKTLIENATEIHCVPSSFFCLVDSMQLPETCTPYFHDIRRNSLMKVNSQWNGYKWQLVNYSVRL